MGLLIVMSVLCVLSVLCDYGLVTDLAIARIYLWAAIGTKNTPPDRVHVVLCPDCAALVPMERADRHARWHRRNG